MMMRKLRLLILCCLLAAANKVKAQVDIGIGGDISFPLMFNGFVKGHNHASTVPGVRLAMNYAPQNGNFSGSLVAGFGPVILPVTRFNNDQDVLYMNFTGMNLTLLGRFRKELNNAELLYGVGVGATHLQGNRVQISKRSENDISRIIEDSSVYNKATLPAFYANVEYIRPANSSGTLYYGIGAQVQYVYFLDQGIQYRVDIIDKNFQYFNLQPELKGHMINPAIFINLYYRLGSRR